VHFLRLLRGGLPGRRHRPDPHFRVSRRKRGDLYYTKQMLLAVGDKNEAQIAADRAQDAPFR
jgi:hypothetical protein